jgi:hypothetical protein
MNFSNDSEALIHNYPFNHSNDNDYLLYFDEANDHA